MYAQSSHFERTSMHVLSISFETCMLEEISTRGHELTYEYMYVVLCRRRSRERRCSRRWTRAAWASRRRRSSCPPPRRAWASRSRASTSAPRSARCRWRTWASSRARARGVRRARRRVRAVAHAAPRDPVLAGHQREFQNKVTGCVRLYLYNACTCTCTMMLLICSSFID